jgi:hypothetical protein
MSAPPETSAAAARWIRVRRACVPTMMMMMMMMMMMAQAMRTVSRLGAFILTAHADVSQIRP